MMFWCLVGFGIGAMMVMYRSSLFMLQYSIQQSPHCTWAISCVCDFQAIPAAKLQVLLSSLGFLGVQFLLHSPTLQGPTSAFEAATIRRREGSNITFLLCVYKEIWHQMR